MTRSGCAAGANTLEVAVGATHAFFFVLFFAFRLGFGRSGLISSRSPGVTSRARKVLSMFATAVR